MLAVQSKWASAIATISATYKDGGDFIKVAADAAGELYAYGHSDVLFKPTKAAKFQFRPTPESAMSYFVGGTNVEDGYDEDYENGDQYDGLWAHGLMSGEGAMILAERVPR